MVDMENEEKDSLCESEVQVLPLSWMGQKYLVWNEAQVLALDLIGECNILSK
jgi:hypothetical protein